MQLILHAFSQQLAPKAPEGAVLESSPAPIPLSSSSIDDAMEIDSIKKRKRENALDDVAMYSAVKPVVEASLDPVTCSSAPVLDATSDVPVALLVVPQSALGQLLRSTALANNAIILDLPNAQPIGVQA